MPGGAIAGISHTWTDPDLRYTFLRYREFLDGLLEELEGTEDVTLVVHDWGSALGFGWAMRHPGSVRAIAYMEALVRPLASWQEWPDAARFSRDCDRRPVSS